MTERVAVAWTPRHGARQRLRIVEDAGGLGLVREDRGPESADWREVGREPICSFGVERA